MHELFSRNQPLLNQELCQCVSLREAGDEKFFARDGLFVWFCYCASLLDHLIRSRQHIGRDRQTNLLGRFEIDDQLELFRLLDREVRRFGAFQNLVHVDSSAFETLSIAVGIGHEAADIYVCIYLEH